MLCLLFQDFDAASVPRRAEFDACIAANLAHPAVGLAIDFSEGGFVNPRFRSHPRLQRHPLDRRLSFADAVQGANTLLPEDTLVVLVNLDVQLGAGWVDVDRLVPPGSKVALCLGRHEIDPDGHVAPDPALARLAHAHAQDAWLWRTPLEVEDADFPLGIAGCDNAFAHRLMQAGRVCRNPMFELQILHRDAGGRVDPYERRGAAPPAAVRPEARGSLLVPAADPGGGYAGAIEKLVRQLDGSSQAQLALSLYNSFVKISN